MGREWPPEDYLDILGHEDVVIDQFNKMVSIALWVMGDDKDFRSALDKANRKRTGSGFPQSVTTPQNEPPKVLPRRMPVGKGGKRGSSGSEKPKGKPKTLLYYRHDNKSMLMEQRKRVDIVLRLWNDWGWIDNETEANDFDRFWEGSPRHCNIEWKANGTILTILLQELIKQPYIKRQIGQAAKSMVEQQFDMTANSDRSRLTEDDEVKIRLTLLVLDTGNPLPKRYRSDGEEEDTSEAALYEVFAGQLHVTKSV